MSNIGERWYPPPAEYGYEVKETGRRWFRYSVHFHHGIARLGELVKLARSEEAAHRKGRKVVGRLRAKG